MLNHGGALLRRAGVLRGGAAVLCKAYAPSLPLSVLARRLGFGEEDAASCLKWLRSVGTVPAHASGRAEMELETRPALRSLDALEAAREAERIEEERRLAAGQAAAGQAAAWSAGCGMAGPAIPEDWLESSW